LIKNDIEVARRSLRPDNAEDGENNSEEEGQGRWRTVNGCCRFPWWMWMWDEMTIGTKI
jgi:hypothetical protein